MQATFTFSETSPAAASTVASSAAVLGATSSGANGVLMGNPSIDQFTNMVVLAQLVGATGGTLDVYMQTSEDNGGTWDDYAHFTQLAAGAGAVKYKFTTSKYGQLLTPATVGVNLTPALAAGTVVGGGWGDRIRLVFVAGASTSAGAAVSIKVSFT